jgi:hypothetical protein
MPRCRPILRAAGVHCDTDKNQRACHSPRTAHNRNFLLLPFLRIDPMACNSSRQYATAVLLDNEQDHVPSPTCPLCHTPATLAQSAIEAGGDWRCIRCGQKCDAARVATVAAYAAWTVDHDRVGSHDPALFPDSRNDSLGGRP